FNKVQLSAALTGAGRVVGTFAYEDGAECLAGVSIWYEPGNQFLDESRSPSWHISTLGRLIFGSDGQQIHWSSFYGEVDPKIRQWWDEVMLPRYKQLSREGLGGGTKKTLLHLRVIGVHPQFQQRGIGKAMVEHMLA
ncbi:unnamed protein product, partial [Rhizoctonia solani]